MLPKTLEWGTDSTTNAANTCLSLCMLLVSLYQFYHILLYQKQAMVVKDIVYFILYYIVYIYSFIKNAPEGAHS